MAKKVGGNPKSGARPQQTCPNCGGIMEIVVLSKGRKVQWYCEKCGHHMPKMRGNMENNNAKQL